MRIDVQPYVWISLATVIVVSIVAGLARAAGNSSSSQLTGRAANAATQIIDSAVRSCYKAEQDALPTQQLTDAQFGLAYVNCGRLLAGSDAALEEVTSTRIDELHLNLKAQQRDALAKIASACPSLSMSRSYVAMEQ